MARYLRLMKLKPLTQRAIGGLRRLADDRRTAWVYLIPIFVIFSLFIGVLKGPNGDPKVQAIALLGLAMISIVVCAVWAGNLSRTDLSGPDYVKGTTTSRMMLWFWVILGFLSFGGEAVGIGARSLIPLWESSFLAFAGVGSVLLTVGPAYREYREARGVDPVQESRRRGGRA